MSTLATHLSSKLPTKPLLEVLPNGETEALSRPLKVARAALFVIFIGMLAATLHPDLRSMVRHSLMKDYRHVLSTVHGDLLSNGVEMTVAKVRTRDHLYLEIYEPREDGGQKLLERLELSDQKDGYFNFNGQATNLAIDDVDGDGRFEILVPGFDQNMLGHLSIYRYDPSAQMFSLSQR